MHSVSLVASYVYENVCDDGLQLVTRKTNVAMYAQFRSNARYVSNGHNAALGSQFTDAHYCTHKIPIFSIMIQSKKKKVININARDFINRWYFVAARLILRQELNGSDNNILLHLLHQERLHNFVVDILVLLSVCLQCGAIEQTPISPLPTWLEFERKRNT